MDARPQSSPFCCFHCGQAVPVGADFPIRLPDGPQPACCAGCQAVAQTIIDNGLGDYYRHRQQTAGQAQPLPQELLQQISLYDHDDIQKSFVVNEPNDIREAALILEGISCAACVWLNEQHIGHLPGVLSIDINYTSHRARVRWDNQRIRLSGILQAIAAIGYRAHPFDADRQEQLAQRERKAALLRLYLAAFSMMQVMMYAVPVYLAEHDTIDADIDTLMRWASLLLTLPVVCYSSLPFYRGTWRDLQAGRPGMDVPVTLGILSAFIASIWATLTQSGQVYFDSVSMFVFLLLAGRYLESQARSKAGSAVERLVRLIPAFAHRVANYPADRIAAEAPVAQLAPNDVLLVKEGETIPADGQLLEGCTSVDESLLTGESRPVAKQPGDPLTGGSVNRGNPLLMQVERVGPNSTLSSIVRLLDKAMAEKPRFAQLADRIAGWFVATLLGIAALTAGGWYLADPGQALWVTVAVLVISCPCALSLATPAALAAATGQLARDGLLVTRGHAIETLSKVDHVVFDKTGTLTLGQMQLIEQKHFSDPTLADSLARGLEQHSSHPIAKSLMSGLSAQPALLEAIRYQAGAGLEGIFAGQTIRLGHQQFVAGLTGTCAPMTEPAQGSAIWLGSRSGWLACYVVDDAVRPDAAPLVAELRRQGVAVSLFSGDRRTTVASLATRLGIDDARAELAPQDKLDAVAALQQQGKTVLMVGDGINDAPVLAAAQVSIAMGTGSDIARASGDMVLLSDRLRPISNGMRTARLTLRIIRQNLWWALGYNLIALPLAIAGQITPWLASLGMAASSLLVVLNALRLTRSPSSR